MGWYFEVFRYRSINSTTTHIFFFLTISFLVFFLLLNYVRPWVLLLLSGERDNSFLKSMNFGVSQKHFRSFQLSIRKEENWALLTTWKGWLAELPNTVTSWVLENNVYLKDCVRGIPVCSPSLVFPYHRKLP